jgi:hypothetical protein
VGVKSCRGCKIKETGDVKYPGSILCSNCVEVEKRRFLLNQIFSSKEDE